jgi:hypothetical protein
LRLYHVEPPVFTARRELFAVPGVNMMGNTGAEEPIEAD